MTLSTQTLPVCTISVVTYGMISSDMVQEEFSRLMTDTSYQFQRRAFLTKSLLWSPSF